MTRITKRLSYLRTAEAGCAIGLSVAFVLLWSRSEERVAWDLRIPALMLVIYLLLQGALYWHLKLRSVTARTELPPFFPRLFRTFKWSNVVAGSLLLSLLLVRASSGAATADVAWSGGLLLFALLEHVNYYSYQLMYDTAGDLQSLRRRGRLRKAALATDLERASVPA